MPGVFLVEPQARVAASFAFLACIFHAKGAFIRGHAKRVPNNQPKNTMQAPYIPSRDADFATWLANFSAKITASPTTYGLIVGDATAIAAVATAFATAYGLATDPATRTTATIAAKDTARATATATVRPYAVRISRDLSVDDADKIEVGVNLPNSSRTPVPPPLTSPALNLVSAIIGQHTLGYADTSTPTQKAKPPGVIAMEVFRALGTTPAVDPAAAELYARVTKSPAALIADPADRGKIATYFGRWVTRSGVGGQAYAGPFGAPLAVTIL